MLASLIRPRRKTKGQSQSSSSRSPFAIRRLESPRSPHPYASPEVFHITPIQSNHNHEDDELSPSARLPLQSPPPPTPTSLTEDSPSPQLTPVRPRTPPRKLDIDLSPNGLKDWIPSHLLDSKIYADEEGPVFGDQSPGAGSSRLPQEPDGATSADNIPESTVGTEVPEVGDGNASVYDDGGYDSVSSEDVLANLQAMDASSFVNAPNQLPHSIRSPPTSQKKTAPAPIKIPSISMHGPKVQVIRSSSESKRASRSFSPSRPESVYSGEDGSGSAAASAVSGTTLARALISNSFVLSSDERTARYRSGGSVLTRMDSATLPRDEQSFLLSSPLMRDRKLSGNSDTLSPPEMMHTLVPLPPNADSVYVPPSHSRRSHADTRDIKTKRRSTGSILSRSDAEGVVSIPVLVRSNSSGSRTAVVDLDHSRISPISEATSSIASTPGHMTPNDDGPSPISANSMYTPSPLSDPLPAEAETSQRNRPLSNVSSSASPTEQAQRPTSSTSSSMKEYDTVLDYYSLSPPAPSPGGSELQETQSTPIQLHDIQHFRPPFSPISEESSSQLSPPMPYKRNSKASVSSSGSPSKVRMEVTGPRKDSHSQTSRLLPIGETSQAQHVSPNSPIVSSSKSIVASLAASSEPQVPLAPPSSLFNRQRSGSAPSPIRVVRDSRDLNTYNITVATRPLSSSGSAPSTAGSGDYMQLQQTFPETPNLFSPMWSAGTSGYSALGRTGRGSMDQFLLAVPPTPMTANGVASATDPMSALAQQMLTRAATSVRGARHSNQPSFSRVRTVAQHLHGVGATLDSQSAPRPVPPETETEESGEGGEGRRYPSWITQRFSTSDEEGGHSEYSTSISMYSMSGESPAAHHSAHQVDEHPLPELPISPPLPDPPISAQGLIVQTTSINTSQTSLNARILPPLPPSPSIFGASSISTPINEGFPTVPPPGLSENNSSSSNSIVPTSPRPDRSSPSVSDFPSRSQQEMSQSAVPGSVVVTPPPQSAVHQNTPPNDPHSERPDSIEVDMAPSIPSMGSPPPYYTLVFDQNHQDSLTPSTGGPSTGDSDYRFRGLSPNSPSSIRDDQSSSRQSTASARRGRSRPPLPIGPRRPTPTNLASGARPRNTSVSSVTSNLPTARLRASSTALKSPRFQSPAPKWRGYTMDAAKWTFTSAQLQAIVSRAIKQSAEASAIRLLRLETVDNEIPNELRRLEMLRTDIKTRYKMMARKRTDMLDILASQIDGSSHEDSGVTLRLVGDLGDTSSALDRLAEELHSVDEQIAQLASLRDVHDASALAMALRKLNASFLKQLSISDALRQQVEVLEGERDDAWRHAETVAREYDHLNERMNDTDSTPSNRSSRVTAMRKSSIRAYKAGLRSARSSSISSSHRLSNASLSGAKSVFSIEDIPPVPPIPRRRPIDIMTDLPITRASAAALSTDGPTPNTETRAMVRAHEELCDMLGITMNDIRPRRAQSVIERPSDTGVTRESRPRSHRASSGRPLSMPDNSGLSEVYQVMTADRNAILATLDFISDTS